MLTVISGYMSMDVSEPVEEVKLANGIALISIGDSVLALCSGEAAMSLWDFEGGDKYGLCMEVHRR